MRMKFAGYDAPFRPWRPELGRVFQSDFAFDSETTRIDEQHPGMIPAYVIGAAFDGQQGYFLTREHIVNFLQLHSDLPMILHHAAFDLEVLNALSLSLNIYDRVEADHIWDTRLLHRLYTLASLGHTSLGPGQSTLASCVEQYLGGQLPKDIQDSKGQLVRTSYDQWLGRPAREIPAVYLEYLGKDVIATFLIAQLLRSRIDQLLSQSASVWGFVSSDWLAAQYRQWGPLTHHIQLRAEIVLRSISRTGMRVDLDRRNDLLAELDQVLDELRRRLRNLGWVPGQQGSGKALQEILRGLERQHHWSLPRTSTGHYQTSRETLEGHCGEDTFVRDYLHYVEVEKLRNTFVSKLGRRRIHPSFNTLMVTGRTSSSGAINAQNLPRDTRVRCCFIPADGYVFLNADYSTVEMATLAQCVQSQFGVRSRMAEAINSGQDLHRLVAARVTGKSLVDVTGEERQKAKPINFGKPGGMGNRRLQQYALSSYAVDLRDNEVEVLSNTWFDLFPEMNDFLYRSERVTPGEAAARFFQLTPAARREHTSHYRDRPQHQNDGEDLRPSSILGCMCLKILQDDHPISRSGRPYSAEDVEYFWTCVIARLPDLPGDIRSAIENRRASPILAQSVRRFLDRQPCFTLTGRLRANASYTARHNTCFQGLAADGAKLALWHLWRAGYRIVNFIHDEVLLEVPVNEDHRMHMGNVKRLMIDGMREVVPDIRIAVECVVGGTWSKDSPPTVITTAV